jgi:hypothetical protein
MNKQIKILLIGVVLILLYMSIQVFFSTKADIDKYLPVTDTPQIYPDYSNIIVPPNIAPLNFRINEKGDEYYVNIFSAKKSITIYSKNPEILIPPPKWADLLQSNHDQKLTFDIYVRNNDQWLRFKSIDNIIADEEIDDFLVYRLIPSVYNYWNNLVICQRNLESFDERTLLSNQLTTTSCINCHTFCKNDPENFFIHSRASVSGMFLVYNNYISLVNTKTEFNNAGAYASWHPNGEMIAFSVNKVTMIYHALDDPRDVFDLSSDLILYKIKSNMITSSPKISGDDYMETYPEWSADGKYLYFCRASKLDMSLPVDSVYHKVKYDLMRITYDPLHDEWGDPELIISSNATNLSVSHPKISPDGRFLLFCMSSYGNFPVYRKSSDLYLLDLQSGQYSYLAINSDQVESYHSWSSNSRWFVFNSKRDDGIYSRPYFCHMNEKGDISKPFILPQRNPGYYDNYFINYNIPQLVKGPVKISPGELAKAAFQKETRLKANLDPRLGEKQDQYIDMAPWETIYH